MKLTHLLVSIVIMMTPWIVVLYVSHEEGLTDERSKSEPKLYCQYGAGHGKLVWDFEDIGNNQILTDRDEVFTLSICTNWSNYGKE